jgi:putative transposase
MEAAGGLADTPKGRDQYLSYLKWLSKDDGAQKEMAFEKMCRGWALGTKVSLRQEKIRNQSQEISNRRTGK